MHTISYGSADAQTLHAQTQHETQPDAPETREYEGRVYRLARVEQFGPNTNTVYLEVEKPE